jgi:hypothetical protein
VVLNLVDASGAAVDLHGIGGSGVAGLGLSLDFNSAISQGGTGPLAFTEGNPAIHFGVFSAFTVTMWIKPKSSLYLGVFPRFFTLGADGLTDRGDSESLQLLSNGVNEALTSVQGFVNARQSDVFNFGVFDLPVNRWSFVALTYDGATLRYFGGSETNAVVLATAENFPAGALDPGASGTIFLGNRLAGDRAFLGEMDDVRFYLGAAPLTFLEDIRKMALTPPRPMISTTFGKNHQLDLQVKTITGAEYILETSVGLELGLAWIPMATNIGSGSIITRSVVLNSISEKQFFRYRVK